MIHRLVLQNLLHRPVRTVLSVIAVGVEVTMILTVVGLSHGMLEESARRARGVGADVLLRPSSTQAAMGLSSAELNQKLVATLAGWPGVRLATSTTVHLLTSNFQTITGVDLEAFSRMSGGLKCIAGGAFEQRFDAIVDEVWARNYGLAVGQSTRIWNRDFRVSGIVEPGKLSRVFIPLATMQDLMGWQGKVSQIYLKLENPDDTPAFLEELKKKLPGYNIFSLEEFTSLFSIANYPGLSAFIRVIVGLAVIVGFLVVMLSMYTAILERTREIGILKSLGASEGYIVGMVLREVAALTLLGIGLGILLSRGVQNAIHRFFPILTVTLHAEWWMWAGLIAVGGAVLGATYPALRAARQDAVTALGYE